MMNDYKELRKYLYSIGEECAADAIEQLVRERDAAIYEMRREADNCKWCKWWKPYANFKYHCTCPNSCCVDGNPDHWEWRGVQE